MVRDGPPGSQDRRSTRLGRRPPRPSQPPRQTAKRRRSCLSTATIPRQPEWRRRRPLRRRSSGKPCDCASTGRCHSGELTRRLALPSTQNSRETGLASIGASVVAAAGRRPGAGHRHGEASSRLGRRLRVKTMADGALVVFWVAGNHPATNGAEGDACDTGVVAGARLGLAALLGSRASVELVES